MYQCHRCFLLYISIPEIKSLNLWYTCSATVCGKTSLNICVNVSVQKKWRHTDSETHFCLCVCVCVRALWHREEVFVCFLCSL